MAWSYIVVGILGLALLMVVHEGGHLLAARAFGMRVIKFSIGFGPAIWRHQPRNSETVYQVALIPFLAYVQIAGMNPMEEIDPDDAGSYANASLIGRITAIFGGPLANYLFATVLFFAALMIGGKEVVKTKIKVVEGGAAAAAQMKDGDRVLAIDGAKIEKWEQLREKVLAKPNEWLAISVDRGGERVVVRVKTEAKGEKGGGQIGVTAMPEYEEVTAGQALVDAFVLPAIVVERLVVGLARIISLKEKADVAGPVGIVKVTAEAAEAGIHSYFMWLGVLSAYLGGFNLLPFPALDGGRLMFLGYEAVTRRRANAKIEAHVHAVGLMMLLALIAVVTIFVDFKR